MSDDSGEEDIHYRKEYQKLGIFKDDFEMNTRDRMDFEVVPEHDPPKQNSYPGEIEEYNKKYELMVEQINKRNKRRETFRARYAARLNESLNDPANILYDSDGEPLSETEYEERVVEDKRRKSGMGVMETREEENMDGENNFMSDLVMNKIQEIDNILVGKSSRATAAQAEKVREKLRAIMEAAIKEVVIKVKMREQITQLKERNGQLERIIQSRGTETAITSQIREKEEEFAVLIVPQEEEKGKEIAEKIKKKGREGGLVGISDFIEAKKGRCIIKTKTREEAKGIEREIREEEGFNGAKIKIQKQGGNKIIFMGFPEEKEDKDIEQALMEDPQLRGSEILKVFKGKTGRKNVIMDVDKETRNKMIRRNRITIDFQRIGIRDYIDIVRCYKCQEYGHMAYGCRKEQKCGRCSGAHDIKICNAETPKCSHCKINNGHPTNSPLCPILKKKKEEKRRQRDKS